MSFQFAQGQLWWGYFLDLLQQEEICEILLWDTGPLVQCWPNDINTPNKICASFYPFWRFFTYVLLCLWFSIHEVFLSGCFFSFSNHPFVSIPPPLLKSLPTYPLSTCTCTHMLHIISILYADLCRTITCIMLDVVKTNEQHLLVLLLIQNQLRNKAVDKQMEIKTNFIGKMYWRIWLRSAAKCSSLTLSRAQLSHPGPGRIRNGWECKMMKERGPMLFLPVSW